MLEQSPTVLVIDDDIVGQTLVCEALRGSTRRLIVLNTPIGASRTVSQEKVDVVVLDVEMPDLSGDKLSRLLRENPRLAYVGVVLVSGRSRAELEVVGHSCGADAVVSKRDVRGTLASAVTDAWRAAVKRHGAAHPPGVVVSLKSTPPPRSRG